MHSLRFFISLFWVGMRFGFQHLMNGGIAVAGLKRSAGFILQPVENWSRYPEFFHAWRFLPSLTSASRVLDLGSPKMFGLALSKWLPGTFVLTDIWKTAIDEFTVMAKKREQVTLAIADATRLEGFADASFDLVYSLSVLEHIENRAAAGVALEEIARVLKPGGVAIISVPVAPTYREIFQEGDVYAASYDGKPVFFQRLYDETEWRRVFGNCTALRLAAVTLIHWRTDNPVLQLWRRVPSKVRGMLGIVNLAIAPFSYEARENVPPGNLTITGEGDVVMRFVKT